MDVRKLITTAERCRGLGVACNDEGLAHQFRLLANEYLDRARRLATSRRRASNVVSRDGTERRMITGTRRACTRRPVRRR